ncbi:hypothetical protein ACOV1W_05775 [Paraclostridium bifermentans]|uniref:hypothetical protein n=1 Tax=Paraclostridium bifermentans TaxID=1490 RepID=UPI003D2D2E25
MHELNRYFEYLLSDKIIVDMKIEREFPNYKNIINMYKEIWQTFIKDELNRSFQKNEIQKIN